MCISPQNLMQSFPNLWTDWMPWNHKNGSICFRARLCVSFYMITLVIFCTKIYWPLLEPVKYTLNRFSFTVCNVTKRFKIDFLGKTIGAHFLPCKPRSFAPWIRNWGPSGTDVIESSSRFTQMYQLVGFLVSLWLGYNGYSVIAVEWRET